MYNDDGYRVTCKVIFVVLAVSLPSSGGTVTLWLFLGQVKEFLDESDASVI